MKKVVIAMFDDHEENKFHDLLKSFDVNKQTEGVSNFSNNPLHYDNIEIEPKCRIVKQNGISIELTNYEFDILHLLARHPGQVFSKKQIYEQIWNLPYLDAEDNVVSLIHRIRKKIEPDPARPVYILTVWGVGYKFSGDWGKPSAP